MINYEICWHLFEMKDPTYTLEVGARLEVLATPFGRPALVRQAPETVVRLRLHHRELALQVAPVGHVEDHAPRVATWAAALECPLDSETTCLSCRAAAYTWGVRKCIHIGGCGPRIFLCMAETEYAR